MCYESETVGEVGCTSCGGIGVVNYFWVCHAIRKVAEDWCYCHYCYPDSFCMCKNPFDSSGLINDEIDVSTYYDLLEQGYTVYPT